jgi:uncharacterized protein YjbI with pentapeptide repeats
MNQKATLELWEKGPAAWNAWAQEMLSRPDKGTALWEQDAAVHFEAHKFCNGADFSGLAMPGEARFDEAMFACSFSLSSATLYGNAHFDGCHFKDGAVFESTRFLGQVYYNVATFDGYPVFAEAKFRSIANFYKVTIHGDAIFNKATFMYLGMNEARFGQRSSFRDARFDGFARFQKVHFEGDAPFVGAVFKRGVHLSRCTFEAASFFSRVEFFGAIDLGGSTLFGPADFQGTKCEGSFDMAGATFHEVPNFIQATFAEAPRLDNVIIQRRVRRNNLDDDLPARWRALKRLALQGHDHIREQEYFAEEVKALRGSPDKPLPNPLNWFKKNTDGLRKPVWPGGGRYWLGRLYQWLSDFGRSVARPLLWWTFLSLVLACVYLWQHFAASAETGTAYAGGPVEWVWSRTVHLLRLTGSSETPGDVALSPISCIRGEGNPLLDALGLSLNKALPLSGIGSPEKLNQIYACLYGIHGGARGALPERFTPVIPDLVYYLGMVQTLFSLVLIFLFLLALRNHFRIR